MDLAEFLLAQIAEDQAALSPWSRGVLDPEASNLEKRFTHERVLAECEAKRRIVEEHRMVRFTDRDLGIVDSPVCWKCHSALDAPDEDDDWTFPFVQDPWPCTTLRLLAMPYAAHEEYLPEWAPTVAV